MINMYSLIENKKNLYENLFNLSKVILNYYSYLLPFFGLKPFSINTL